MVCGVGRESPFWVAWCFHPPNIVKFIPLGDRGREQRLETSKQLPSGYVKIAIENGHRNSGFSHEKWWIFPLLCKRLPEGRSSGASSLEYAGLKATTVTYKKSGFPNHGCCNNVQFNGKKMRVS